jgi:hypothetical protein
MNGNRSGRTPQARNATPAKKKTHQAGAKHKKKAPTGAELSIRIGSTVQCLPLAQLLNTDTVGALEKECRQASKTPVVYLDDLLDYPERQRWALLESSRPGALSYCCGRAAL